MLLFPENFSTCKINFSGRPSRDLTGRTDQRNLLREGAEVKWNFPQTIHQFFYNYAFIVKKDIQLLGYHRMKRIWTPPPPFFALA